MGISQSKDSLTTDNSSTNHQEKHKHLDDMLNSEDEIECSIVFFNPPITFEYPRQVKGYLNELDGRSDDDLSNPIYNEIFISSLGLKITEENVYTENNLGCTIKTHIDDKYTACRGRDRKFYRYFDFDKTEIPQEIKDSAARIKELEEEIKLIQTQIDNEKAKIGSSEFVRKIRRNNYGRKRVIAVKEYLEEISNFFKSHR